MGQRLTERRRQLMTKFDPAIVLGENSDLAQPVFKLGRGL
jgi:hypothetical protein